jgi:hypothetical protein
MADLLELFGKTDAYELVAARENKSFSLELHNLIWNEAKNLRKKDSCWIMLIILPVL